MLSPARIARLGLHATRLVINPANLNAVFGIVRAVNTPAQLADQRAHLKKFPHVAAAMAQRQRLNVDIPTLSALEPGTLGRSFADFIRANGLDTSVLTEQTLGESEWVSIHMYETHDLLHVLIGADTSVLGELQLQAFVSAQIPWERLAPIAMGVGFFRAGLGHAELTPAAVLDAIGAGREKGRAASLLFGVDWSQHWQRPLAEVRTEFGLPRSC
jgi:ubiquinone biosynthesis protein COQ4